MLGTMIDGKDEQVAMDLPPWDCDMILAVETRTDLYGMKMFCTR